MKKSFKNLLAIFFPWAIFLMLDNPGAALIAIIMQVTIIGWIPASIWAWQTLYPKKHAGEKDRE